MPKLASHTKVILIAFASGLPALVFMSITIAQGDFSNLSLYTLLVLVISVYALCIGWLYKLVARPWQVIANIVSSLKERDYTLRVRYPNIEDPMGLSFAELNSLADYMQNQRLDMIQTHELLFKILQEVEAAVLCFDQDEKLVMANEFARKLYKNDAKEALHGTVADLGLKEYFESNLQSAHEIDFPNRKSRWLVKRSSYRENGRPHTMLLVADLQGPLREEELDAWRKLIRVLGHELNNSMTPLKSMANSLTRILKRDPLPDDWKEDMTEGLTVIGRRVDGLSRFVTGYSELARIPLPQRVPFDVGEFMVRATVFDGRENISLVEGPSCSLVGDEGQLEQVMINLLKNAIEAVTSNDGDVVATWELGESEIRISILDDGHGLASDDNVFVPFFSTKTTGSGIGLALSRQIVEAHGGRLTLENRTDCSGCVATLALPL